MTAVLFVSVPVLRAQDNDKILNRPYADMKRLHYGFSVGFHNQSLGMTRNGFVTESGETWYPEVAELAPGFASTSWATCGLPSISISDCRRECISEARL